MESKLLKNKLELRSLYMAMWSSNWVINNQKIK
jgi:hypothetical protein